jgi:hypothetical protein
MTAVRVEHGVKAWASHGKAGIIIIVCINMVSLESRQPEVSHVYRTVYSRRDGKIFTAQNMKFFCLGSTITVSYAFNLPLKSPNLHSGIHELKY